MAPVRKTLQQYVLHRDRLNARLEDLKEKRDILNQPYHPEGLINVSSAENEDNASEGQPTIRVRSEITVSPSQQSVLATEVLIEIIQVKLGFLNDTIASLQTLVKENPRQTTPIELQLTRFDDWVDTNQQLYELNTRLYDIQKNMLDIRLTQTSIRQHESQNASLTQNSVEPDSVLRTFQTVSPTLISTYISERLHPRNNRMTFEATKIEEYIHECTQYQRGTLDNPPTDSQNHIRGAHPQSYHRFVELLCNYITQRHSSSQGQELQSSDVYTAIEHQLIPRVKPFIMAYVMDQEKDKRLNEKCLAFQGITLSQLRVPVEYQTKELIPFANAIAYLKGSVFAASPTDKMYSIVKAAKSLHDIIGMGEGRGIDGDTFLDLWIYVTIKANMKNMATNVRLMSEYGNPRLSIGEAGYYLTTITAAMNYIENLTADKLGEQIENNSTFLVCESARVKALCDINGSGIVLVEDGIVLTGYRVAVIRKWALDTSKLFSTILVHTGDEDDKVSVSMIKLSSATGSPETIQFLYDVLTEPQVPWIMCNNIMNSVARVAESASAIKEQLILLPPLPAITDESLDTLSYVLQLIRVSSDTINREETTRSMSLRQPKETGLSDDHNSLLFKPDFESSDSFLEVNSGSRSRFSLPVRRFLTRKSTKPSSIQTERHRGKRLDDDHRPLPSSSPSSPPGGTGYDPSPASIVITAEVHSTSLSPTLLSPLTMSTSTDDDGGNTEGENRWSSGHPDITMADLFSIQYKETLESNFVQNHLDGVPSGSVSNRLREVVQQCQLVLQRLGYLSSLHTLDGIYDDIVRNAVQAYQINQNEQKLVSSLSLPLDGILGVRTFKLMKQDYIQRFNDMISVYKEVVGSPSADMANTKRLFGEFPLLIEQADIDEFTSLVKTFQKKAGLGNKCRVGVLCGDTNECVKKLIMRRNTFA